MMKNICLFLFLLCIGNAGIAQMQPIKIKFDPENMRESDKGLSAFIESIEYIPLETTDECVIDKGMVFDYDDTHIIIKDNTCKSAYLFDREGNFQRTIGSTGGGPNEFVDGIHCVYLDEDNHTIIAGTLGKALCFNKEGEILWTTVFPKNEDRSIVAYFQGKFLRSRNSYYFPDSVYPVYTLYDQTAHLLKEAVPSLRMPPLKNKQWRISFATRHIVPVYMYQNMPHVREYLNDTVYKINGLNQFIPKYVFDLGKYKVTPEIQADIEHFADKTYNKVIIAEIIETSQVLLLQYYYKGTIRCCYYDKNDKRLYSFDSLGYPNDYDRGVNFVLNWSRGQKNRFAQTSFSAEEFLFFFKQCQQEKRPVRGPQSAVRAFEKLVKKVDPDDNPIIMIVKLKE